MKIVKSLEDSGLSVKDATQTIKNETKEQRGEFIGMLVGTLGVSLLENMLADKEIDKTCDFSTELSMPPYAMTNFETQKYYQNKTKLKGVYSRNNLPKI